MRVASREAFRVVPRWFNELSVGVGLFGFSAATLYPWRGTTSELALAVGIGLAVAGAFVLTHSVHLGRRAHWRWLTVDATDEKVVFPKERATATAIALLMLAAVGWTLDFSAHPLALRSGWWLVVTVCVAFSFLLFVGWRARN